jgi:hypothetical protein
MRFTTRDFIWLTIVVVLLLGGAALWFIGKREVQNIVRTANTMFAEKEGDRRELEEKLRDALDENERLKAKLESQSAPSNP